MIAQDTVFSYKIFLNAALPLVKVIASDIPALAQKFEQAHCVFQVSALDPDAPGGKVATHFTVNNGEWKVCADKVATNAQVELQFKSIDAFVGFMKGKIGPATLPKMRGAVKHTGMFLAFMQVLLKMSSLLGATQPPEDEETKVLLVKSFFYLLSSGVSCLNKNGHEGVNSWTKPSPDRVYSWAVNGHPEVAAYIRIKAGKSRAGRGEYKRAMPFFTLRFDNLDSALGTLLGTDDMMDATKAGRLIMDGAPEFGAQLGDFMLTVAAYAK
ncbi:MAG: hypothetical protein LBS96_03550 [Oscillospiraceae bacterium]|jgi:hypothetical protein|nr:hypothetical protein [Oscillospiraceae bacterium]